MNTTNKIIVIDLEATCWDGEVPAGQVNEIIEIGIALLDTATGDITQNTGILIRPERSVVSPFCTQLTTITQALLDKEGTGFNEACDRLRKEYGSQEYTWASYGAYDLNMMRSQCKARQVEYPLSAHHINVKELFREKSRMQKKVGMAGALAILDLPLEGTHHRGVDDARNIARILHWCLDKNEQALRQK